MPGHDRANRVSDLPAKPNVAPYQNVYTQAPQTLHSPLQSSMDEARSRLNSRFEEEEPERWDGMS